MRLDALPSAGGGHGPPVDGPRVAPLAVPTPSVGPEAAAERGEAAAERGAADLDQAVRRVLDLIDHGHAVDHGHATRPAVQAGTPTIRSTRPRPAREAAWPSWAPQPVVEALRVRGVAQPWSHQVRAMDLAWGGQHVVVATGPASGKTLAYQVPAVAAALAGGRTLYLSPTTALAADQAERLADLDVAGVGAVSLSGDSGTEERRWARDRSHVVLTTPDLVHHCVLPRAAEWTRFLRRLRFVVVDECHAYRGVFGAHVAAVLRRLLRAARLRGADPVVVACSATAGEPGAFVARLCGVDPVCVAEDGAPHPGSATIVHPAGGQRRTVAARLFEECVGNGLQTVAFASSRVGAESLARQARRGLERRETGDGADASGVVASYRGGHLGSERRAVERDLRSGSLLGVATTSALEVGVDVSGLDVVVLDGWPGTATSFHQRSGRAGRAGRPGVTVLVAGDDPVDAHLCARPEDVLSRPVEAAVADPDNPYVLAPQLAAAALESPLTDDDLDLFGPAALDVVRVMEARGDLRRRPAGWFWARREPPAPAGLRAAGGRPVTLLETGTGRVLGDVDADRARQAVHPGAVYLHRWDTYVVDELDLDAGVALLHPEDPGWVTTPRHHTEVRHVEELATSRSGDGLVSYGTVAVERRVVGYTRRDPVSHEVIDERPLAMPGHEIVTRGVWWRPGTASPGTRGPRHRESSYPALHAAEHVLVAMVPLLVPCDRFDVAAHTRAADQDEGVPATLTVWDAWPGGAGYAERAFSRWPQWLRAASERLSDCPCETGCLSCVVQPGCEHGNRRLDKAGAARLLGHDPGS